MINFSLLDDTLELCDIKNECNMKNSGFHEEWNKITDNATDTSILVRDYLVQLHESHVREGLEDPFSVDNHTKIVIEDLFLMRYVHSGRYYKMQILFQTVQRLFSWSVHNMLHWYNYCLADFSCRCQSMLFLNRTYNHYVIEVFKTNNDDKPMSNRRQQRTRHHSPPVVNVTTEVVPYFASTWSTISSIRELKMIQK